MSVSKAKRWKLRLKDTHCHYCGREFGEGNSRATIDHKVPLHKHGPDSIENALMCCHRCNVWKGKIDYEKFKYDLLPLWLRRLADKPDCPKYRNGKPKLIQGK